MSSSGSGSISFARPTAIGSLPNTTTAPTTTSAASSSSSASQAAQTQASIAAAAAANEKPRLTEQEKKNNHIASEQKRRQAIREGFDRLTELVPGLEGQGRSESIVLKRTIDFMRDQIDERRRLVARVEASGGVVNEDMRV